MGFETVGISRVKFRGVEIAMPLDVTDVTDNGIISDDPGLVSAAAGQHVVEHIVSIAAKFVRAFRDAPLQAATRSGGHA